MYETVRHFQGRVNNWEIWNEPNVGYRFWKPTLSGDPEAYGDLLEVAYDAAKAADPASTVALGGTFYPNVLVDGSLRFLEEVYLTHPDIGDFFDVMAYHPYRYPFTAPEIENGYQDSLQTSIEKMRSMLERHGDGDKALWITEMGWHTAVQQPVFSGATPEEQAQYLVRGFLIALNEGLEKVCWYTFSDGEDPWVWQEDAFGLFRDDEDWTDDITPLEKPSYRAYRTMTSVLSGMSFSADLTAAQGLTGAGHAFQLENSGRTVYVAWTIEDGAEYQLVLDGLPRSVTVVDLEGGTTEAETVGGTLALWLSPSPSYVVVGP